MPSLLHVLAALWARFTFCCASATCSSNANDQLIQNNMTKGICQAWAADKHCEDCSKTWQKTSPLHASADTGAPVSTQAPTDAPKPILAAEFALKLVVKAVTKSSDLPSIAAELPPLLAKVLAVPSARIRIFSVAHHLGLDSTTKTVM